MDYWIQKENIKNEIFMLKLEIIPLSVNLS